MQKKRIEDGEKAGDDEDGGPSAMTLDHLQGGFMLLLGGLTLGLLSFSVELCLYQVFSSKKVD